MDIILVRHGEAAASWSTSADPDLSEAGRREAQQAADQIKQTLAPGSVLISSPLARARQTAEPLSQLALLPVKVDTTFREIPAPVPLPERQAWLRQFMQQHWPQQAPELQDWRAAILDRLMALEKPAVIFTHFLVINAVVGHVQGRSATLCCWPANGSVTRFRRSVNSLELVALGQEMQTTVN
jgi:broad specificity phosphatase PhoE